MIPRIIHQTWKTSDVPEKWQASYQQWRTFAHKNHFEYFLWTDADNDDFMERYYPEWVELFRSYKHGIQRADMIRYFLLHHYGGIYSDLDIAPKDNFLEFFELYSTHEMVCAQTKAGNSAAGQNFTNAFMMSAPRSSFWPVTWSLLRTPHQVHRWKKPLMRHFPYFNVIFGTGPGVICDAARLWQQQAQKRVATIPAQLVQPTDNSAPESVCTVLEGSSWHQKDARVVMAFKGAYENRGWIAIGLLTTFLAWAIVMTVLYARQTH